VEFKVLGPLQVGAGRVVIGTARKRQLVLAVLLARAGQPVPIDSVVEAVWGERAPVSARRNIQLYVHELRRALDEGLITTLGDGYLIDPGNNLDATRFRRYATDGHSELDAGDPVGAEATLRMALDLWRGPAYAEFLDCRLVADEAQRLELMRLDTYERWAEAQLTIGATPALVGELAQLCRLHPVRETLHAHLMRALYQTGRQAEALAVFRDLRGLLSDQLGVEPSPLLQRLHQAMLRGDETLTASPRDGVNLAVRSTVPHELPPEPTSFTGRERALEALDDALLDADGPTRPVVICGMGGVGKTTLAVYWGHRVADRYPDGQLYLNLRGYASSVPMRPVEALGQLLRALGVPAAQIPADLDAAVGMFRTRLTGRRVLVVLDNARDAEQVRALLPAAPGCLALVTSRDRLTGLVARDGARRLTLGVLAPAEAAALVTRLLGDAGPDAAATLARGCGYLPLAIRIAAAYLADRPGLTIAAYAEALRSSLDGLEADGDPEASIRSTFAYSYHALDPAPARLFRLLGLVPGHDLTPPAAAALADTDLDEARRLLDTLARAHFLKPDRPGRYALHDLLRTYAGELASTGGLDPELKDALGRLHDFYLSAVDAAANMVYPRIARLPVEVPDRFPHRTTFPDRATAVAWLDAELANLMAMAQHAAIHGPRRAAWLLADALHRYFWHRRRHGADWVITAEAGLAAAVADGDQRASAAAHLGLARAYRNVGRTTSAVRHATRALTMSRRLGWLEGQASALGRLAVAQAELGHNEQALAGFDEALAINQQIAQPAHRAELLTDRSALWFRIGQLQQSVADGLAALELYRGHDPAGEAYAQLNTAVGFLYLGAGDRARHHITHSLRLFNSIGERYGQGRARCVLTRLHFDAGRYDAALECASATLRDALLVYHHASAALSLIDLVEIRRRLGDHQHAVRDSARAVELARRAGRPHAEVQALVGLADSYRHEGQPGEAMHSIAAARRITERYGYRLLEGHARTVLGEIRLAAGDRVTATAHAEAALAIHAQTGYRLGEARTRALLSQLRPTR
jgi:DNA-binding SARP family transcriptional activator